MTLTRGSAGTATTKQSATERIGARPLTPIGRDSSSSRRSPGATTPLRPAGMLPHRAGIVDCWDLRGKTKDVKTPPNAQSAPRETSAVVDPNPILRFPHLTIANGIYNVLHGLGSFWNHACEYKLRGRADVEGMLSVVVFAVAYNPLQLFSRVADPDDRVATTTRIHIEPVLWLLPPLSQTLLFVLAWHGTIPAILTFTVLVGVTVEIIPLSLVYLYCWRNKKAYPVGQGKQLRQQRHRLRWWIYPLGIFLFGMAHRAWKPDLAKVSCFDEGILRVLQGHAVWHVLSAVALGCTYYLYQGEEITVVLTATTAEAVATAAGNDDENDDAVPHDELAAKILVVEGSPPPAVAPTSVAGTRGCDEIP